MLSMLYSKYLLKHRGACVARRFAKNYAVALLARNSSNLDPVADEINAAGGKAIGIKCDTSDGKSVKAAFEQLQKEMGGAGLAAAIYNVGGRFVRKPFLELSDEEFESGWEANGYVETTIGKRSEQLLTSAQTRSFPLFASRSAPSTQEHRCRIPAYPDLHICNCSDERLGLVRVFRYGQVRNESFGTIVSKRIWS